MAEERVVSGIQPTGDLHLGNYFGAVANWLQLQETYGDCVFFIVDYHAITEDWDPETLRQRTFDMGADLLACGLDPARSILFVQSHVPEHAELCWILTSVTSYGDLQRMTQFKDRREEAEEADEFVSAGLFTYPVLQAADILIYHGNRVPVGEDQLQHIELTRRIARRFNHHFGAFFPEPEGLLGEAPKLMSPADPERKMSKSLGPKHYIGLMEEEDAIWDKIRTAVTDVGPQSDTMSPGVANLFQLLELSAPASVYGEFERSYEAGTLQYGRLKEAVHEHLMATLRPIRERRAELGEADVRHALHEGAERARALATDTLQEVRRRIGVGPS